MKRRAFWVSAVVALAFTVGCASFSRLSDWGRRNTRPDRNARPSMSKSEKEPYEISRKEKAAILAKYLGEELATLLPEEAVPVIPKGKARVADLIAEGEPKMLLPHHRQAVRKAMEEDSGGRIYHGAFKKETPVGSKVLERERAAMVEVATGKPANLTYVVPDLKPAKCQCRLPFPPADLKGGYFIALRAKARRRGTSVARRMGLRIVGIPTSPKASRSYSWAAGSFEKRWQARVAMEKIRKFGHLDSDDLKVIYRPSVARMTEIYPVDRPKCSYSAEKALNKFLFLAGNPAKRGEAMLEYPRTVSQLVGSKLNRNALFAFYTAAMNLFFDTGHADLAYQAAQKRAEILPKPSVTVLSDVVRAAKVLGSPGRLKQAYLMKARALRDRNSAEALKAYRNALTLRSDRELLLEVASYLEGLGNKTLAKKMRGQAYGLDVR